MHAHTHSLICMVEPLNSTNTNTCGWCVYISFYCISCSLMSLCRVYISKETTIKKAYIVHQIPWFPGNEEIYTTLLARSCLHWSSCQTLLDNNWSSSLNQVPCSPTVCSRLHCSQFQRRYQLGFRSYEDVDLDSKSVVLGMCIGHDTFNVLFTYRHNRHFRSKMKPTSYVKTYLLPWSGLCIEITILT